MPIRSGKPQLPQSYCKPELHVVELGRRRNEPEPEPEAPEPEPEPVQKSKKRVQKDKREYKKKARALEEAASLEEAVRVLQDLLREEGGECDVSVLIQQLRDKHPALKAAAGIKKPRAWLKKCGGGLFILGPANKVLAAYEGAVRSLRLTPFSFVLSIPVGTPNDGACKMATRQQPVQPPRSAGLPRAPRSLAVLFWPNRGVGDAEWPVQGQAARRSRTSWSWEC